METENLETHSSGVCKGQGQTQTAQAHLQEPIHKEQLLPHYPHCTHVLLFILPMCLTPLISLHVGLFQIVSKGLIELSETF